MHRLSRHAAKKRDALFLILGRRCAACYSSKNLSFDVIVPTAEPSSHHANFSWLQRINFYCRQLSAGNLQILCDKCNTRKHDGDTRYILPAVSFDGRAGKLCQPF